MSDDIDRTHADLPAPAAEPADDTDLIAYLDGELDAAAAARVEARLARDPAARAAADAYAKSFDLLDYLPKPDSTPDFTARTVTRLPVVTGAATPPPSPAGLAPLPPRRRAWPELLAWGAAAALVLVLGYVGHALARPHLTPAPVVEEPTLADLEVIERLPLYAGVDDLAFLKQLDAADLFADDGPAAPPHAEATGEDRGRLIAQFRGLPAARQQQLRTLHADLAALDPKAAAPVLATLHAYAAWLDRLPEAERKRVLAAPTADERLTAVRQAKEAQWRDTLTPRQKELLRNAPNTLDRETMAAEFRLQDSRRRDEWSLARSQWQEVSEKGRKPWPFDDPKRAEQIETYIRVTLGADLSAPPPSRNMGPDPQPHCRLTREQFTELKALHDAARTDGGWAWLQYGACLLRLSDAHPSLPLSKDGKAITGPDQVPRDYKLFVQPMPMIPGLPLPKGGKPGWQAHVGRWPEFALALHDQFGRRPKGFGAPQSPLGPCRPDDFADEVASLVRGPLAAVPGAEAALKGLEGKWPEYPRKVLELARKADLSVPGVTLPGEPSKWDRLYRLTPGKR